MGMPRDRKVMVGLGAVAVAGLMVDKVFLGPADASADTTALAAGSAAPGAPAAAGIVPARIEAGIREVMLRMLHAEGLETPPSLHFGPDPSWTVRPTVLAPPVTSAPVSESGTDRGGILPGLTRTPTLSMIMPARDGGLAVIDGHRLRPGETHPDGYTLVSIQDRAVTISMGGSTASITLRSPGN